MASEVSTRTNGLPLEVENPISSIIRDIEPRYFTEYGAAYCADSLDFLKRVQSESVSLVVTSPPYPLVFKKEYGNVDAANYVEWIIGFVPEIRRILREDGSFVLNLGGVWTKGAPVRSLVHYEVALAISRLMPLAQEFFWYNPAKMPAPAEWVNVRRIRVKDSVEFVWWFGKTENPRADNRRVLNPYSSDMKRLIQRGIRTAQRPSGHNIRKSFALDRGGAIPPNLIQAGNTDATSDYFQRCAERGLTPHPARYPREIPSFFIRLTTDPGQVVLDPFAGSNTTGAVAQALMRRWIAVEKNPVYVDESAIRFPPTAIYGSLRQSQARSRLKNAAPARGTVINRRSQTRSSETT